MTQSIWDDPELKAGGEFVTFENVGDTVSGTITATRIHRFDDGKVVPQILITTDDGEDRTVTAGQVRLKAELAEKRPEAGDHVKITMSNIEKRSGGKTLKHFTVEIQPGNGSAPVMPPDVLAGEVAAPVIDPAAAAEAMAKLTPEQRAEFGL